MQTPTSFRWLIQLAVVAAFLSATNGVPTAGIAQGAQAQPEAATTQVAQEAQAQPEAVASSSAKPDPALQTAIKKLKIPGLAIKLEERCIDIEARICLNKGPLELVACTPGTKEHESIVAIEARSMHIHTALLLLGADAGNPALRQAPTDDNPQWIIQPPRGSPVDVLLVFPDQAGQLVEHPISQFIMSSAEEPEVARDAAVDKQRKGMFPTHSFLFAGSHLVEDGPGPRKYLSDESGNVISIVTFGDELLCLAEVHSDQKEALQWQVNAAGLPAVGTNVILRLRPHLTEGALPQPATKEPR